MHVSYSLPVGIPWHDASMLPNDMYCIFKVNVIAVLRQAQLQSSTTESSELEVALHTEIGGLKSELDEAKRKASRLGQETQELRQSLEVKEREKETFAQSQSQLEEARLQQEKALEKLTKEVRHRERCPWNTLGFTAR